MTRRPPTLNSEVDVSAVGLGENEYDGGDVLGKTWGG
jgi:hypothetical protein